MLDGIFGFAPLGLSIIAGVIWAVRLEGKVKVEVQRVDDLKELINTRFDSSDGRLDRIERSLNGHLIRD